MNLFTIKLDIMGTQIEKNPALLHMIIYNNNYV